MPEESSNQENMSDEERNFENLRKSKEAAEARVAELLPYAVESTVRKVGLDPSTGNGLVLKDMLGNDPSEERAQELIEKYGWKAGGEGDAAAPPSPHQPNPSEQVQLDAAARQQAVQTVAVPAGGPQTVNDQLALANAKLAQAVSEGNNDARRQALKEINQLNTQKLVAMFEG